MSDDELRNLMVDLKRHFDVTAEGLRGEIRTVAEGVLTVEQQASRGFDDVRRGFSDLDKRFDDTQSLVRLSYSHLRTGWRRSSRV